MDRVVGVCSLCKQSGHNKRTCGASATPKIEVTPVVKEKASTVPMPTVPIDIKAYGKKFTEYPADLTAFAEAHGLTLPGIDSLKGQAIALLAQPENRGARHVDRAIAIEFFATIGIPTDDAIQPFNKATGLHRVKCKRGLYCLQYPFVTDTVSIDKRKGCALSGDKETAVNAIKEFWRKNLVDVPVERWQLGHLDPTIPDASEKNLAWQPDWQARYRDRFKWDAYFHKMWPTADELVPKFDEYYTAEEQIRLFHALKAKLKL